jgi:hypothetical protein
MQLGRQNADGTPDYHGWPDRFGFLPSSQAVFNPIGGGSDDDCNPPNSRCVPIRDVLAFPPQPITSPLAIEAAASSFTGIDFVPLSFVKDPVETYAALYTLEGDFGFSTPNATDPAPEVGHEVKLINFNQSGQTTLALKIENFARNVTGDQAFVTNINGFNRPTNIRFGPDGRAYVVGLRRSPRSRLRLTFCRCCQWAARSDSWHGRDLEDLPIKITIYVSPTGGQLPPLFLFASINSPRARRVIGRSSAADP